MQRRQLPMLLLTVVVLLLGSARIASLESEGGDEPAGVDWVQADPQTGPSAREGHAMAYDSRSSLTILYGGRTASPLVLSNETWAYDAGLDSWSVRRPRQTPGPLTGHAMAYDAKSGRAILFGGLEENRGAVAETWAYDYQNDTWTSLRPPNPPPARGWHAMAYDARSDVVVMFGGWPLGSPEFDDTWAYDFNANTWRNMNPTTHPSGRIGHGMAYDFESDRVILFGGGINPYSDETWAYDYDRNSWTKMNPSTHPSARIHHAMAYGDALDRVVLFGGSAIQGGLQDDTWAYDFETDSWANLAPSAAPMQRSGHRMAYDARHSCLVLFGGGTQTPPYRSDETWWYPTCTGDPSRLPAGDVVMVTDKPCYRPGEPVQITATGWAQVPSIGDFPLIFWAVTNASGDPVFETSNPADAVGGFNGTLNGTWNQTYRRLFGGQPPTGTPVPPGTYVIWFYELTPPNETPPDWVVPATIEIGDCGGGPPTATVIFRLVPRTLNLKSEGKWVTAHIAVTNATAADIDPATLTLQGVSVAWYHITSNDTMIAKFDRAEFASTVTPEGAVVVTLAGRWIDGGSFTATDTIRVIQPGR